MEPELHDAARTEAPPRNELRALAYLRDRVEAAAREVERLREENAALAARVADLQTHSGQTHSGTAALSLPGGEEPQKLRAQIQGFIAAIDQVLNTPEPADAARRRDR
jgi:hypothetical protein